MRAQEPLDQLISRISVDRKEPILNTLKKMDALGMKLLLVLDNGSFHSVVSIGDVQRAIIKGVKLEDSVEGILRDVITVCYEDESNEKIREKMIHFRAEFMPVLNENNEISRIFFWKDIVEDGSLDDLSEIDLPVVIMAGGKGTRLKPLTNIIPKPLVPVGEKSIIEMIFDSFSRFGMSRFFLIVNYKASMIENYISEMQENHYTVEVIREEEAFGTGGSLYLLKDTIDTPFFLTNCDTLLDQDFTEVYNFHRENRNELTIVGALKHYPIPYGTMEVENGGILTELKEKPELTIMVNSGTYIVEPHLFDEIPERKFFHITELIDKIKKRSGKVGVFPVSEMSWLDIGEWKEFTRTEEFLKTRRLLR